MPKITNSSNVSPVKRISIHRGDESPPLTLNRLRIFVLITVITYSGRWAETQPCDWLASLTDPGSINALLELPVLVTYLGRCLLYLLGTEVGDGLPHFAGPPLDDRVAEHRDDHDEQEVARVHQVQVDEGAVVLVRGRSELDFTVTAGFWI